MRTIRALRILAFAMLGLAGPPICGSEGVARADDSAAARKKSDRIADSQLVPDQYETLMQGLQQLGTEHADRNPQVEQESRRDLRRGDFWRPGASSMSNRAHGDADEIEDDMTERRTRDGMPARGSSAAGYWRDEA